jgi:hypothetical protein
MYCDLAYEEENVRFISSTVIWKSHGNQVQASVRMYGCCYLTKIGIVSFNALSKEINGCSC